MFRFPSLLAVERQSFETHEVVGFTSKHQLPAKLAIITFEGERQRAGRELSRA
jgi:hypothetical protein